MRRNWYSKGSSVVTTEEDEKTVFSLRYSFYSKNGRRLTTNSADGYGVGLRAMPRTEKHMTVLV